MNQCTKWLRGQSLRFRRNSVALAWCGAAVLFIVPAFAQTNTPAPVPDPAELYDEVKDAISKRDFTEAQRIVDRIITIDPSFPEAHRASAYVNFELGRYAEAEEALERFRQLVPGDRHNILILLGRIQMARARYRDAARTFERVSVLKPTAEGIYTSLGKLYYRLEEFGLAIERLETARERDPPRFHQEAVNVLKNAYARQIDALVDEDRFDQAVIYLDRVLDLDPPMVVAFLKRGAVLSGLDRDLSQAETDVITYVSENPGTARAFLLLGNIRQKRGRTGKAIRSYEHALELDPDIPGVNAVIGTLCYRMRNFEKAVDHLRKAAELAPGDANIRYTLGMAYLRMEKFDSAKEAMASVTEVSPASPGPYLILAQVALHEGRIQLALDYLEQWAPRVRKRTDLDVLDKDRIFELLYSNSQYRALVRDLKSRL